MTSGSGISLDALASIPSNRFWLENSLLNRTRLNRFIFYSLIFHLVLLLLNLLSPNKTSVEGPPPIQVKFIETEKPMSKSEQGTIIDAPKPKKIEKPKSSELLASQDSRAHSNVKKSTKKKYRQKKTVVPKASGIPKAAKKSTRPKKKVSRTVAKQKPVEKKQPLPVTNRGAVIPKVQEQPKVVPKVQEQPQKETVASMNSGSRGSLSMLDGFDPNKYASIDTNTADLEDDFDGEDVSLDTTETKYASYFARIKHQIERVWTYPTEAAQRGINGRLTLRFRISKDGNLLSARVVDQSGHEILDFAAIKAVKEAAPFYPFPIDIKKEKLSILATFIYSPSYSLKK